MIDPKAAQERTRETARRSARADRPTRVDWHGLLRTGLALLAAGIGLFLAWQTVSSLLIIFAGVLFAAFLDASARALAPVLPVSRTWRLTLVVLLLAALLHLAWSGGWQAAGANASPSESDG